MNRLTPALAPALTFALLAAHGCGFTSEPDPGHGDVDQGAVPIDDAGAADQGGARDAGLDANVTVDAAPPPDDQGITDAAPDDLGPPPTDLGPRPDGDLLDGGPLDGPPPDPLDLACEAVCDLLAACRQNPHGTCEVDCRAEARDPDRLRACADTHLADDRCHEDGYRRCLDDIPPPIDPVCTAACEALAACRFPTSPDCARECDGEPGPARRHLARCADATTTADCDIATFVDCAAEDPTLEDHCAYVCEVLSACGEPPDCPAACPDDPTPYNALCVEAHLDRGACALTPYHRCLDP